MAPAAAQHPRQPAWSQPKQWASEALPCPTLQSQAPEVVGWNVSGFVSGSSRGWAACGASGKDLSRLRVAPAAALYPPPASMAAILRCTHGLPCSAGVAMSVHAALGKGWTTLLRQLASVRPLPGLWTSRHCTKAHMGSSTCAAIGAALGSPSHAAAQTSGRKRR